MIEPTALPSARPGAPCSAANTLTEASGSVVPMLTMVAPISIVGTPQRSDSATACLHQQVRALHQDQNRPRDHREQGREGQLLSQRGQPCFHRCAIMARA